MKKFLNNNDGIAFVTSLMLTLISLTIVMAVMYIITQSIQQSGMTNRYKTALEASYGGTEIIMKELVPAILANSESATLFTDLQIKYLSLNLSVNPSPAVQLCIQQKLSQQVSEWTSCTATALTVNAKEQPDLTFSLQGLNASPYTIYAKIVDTVKGNTDMSGLQLEGAGVAESITVLNPKNVPFVYRLEIQAERSTNAVEQGNMSVVYAY
jgi:hypothetical protein